MAAKISNGIVAVVVIVAAVLLCLGYWIYDKARPTSISGPHAEVCGSRPSDLAISDSEFKLEGANFGKLAVGQLDMATKQQVVKLLPETSKNAIVCEFLICEAEARGEVDKSDLPQVNYLRSILLFMQTGPSTDQFEDWQKNNPFPIRTSQLDIPNMEDEGNRKILRFTGAEAFLPIKLINGGHSELTVWLDHFPERVFYPVPNTGPWTIPAHADKEVTVVFMNVKPTVTEFPFQIRVAGGEVVEAKIVIPTLSAPAKYGELFGTLDQKFAGLAATKTTDSSKYDVAYKYAVDLFPTVDDVARKIVTWQVLTDVREPAAALKALEAASKESPASKSNPAFFDILAKTYSAIGDEKRARIAIYDKREATVKPGEPLFWNAQ